MYKNVRQSRFGSLLGGYFDQGKRERKEKGERKKSKVNMVTEKSKII